MCFLALISKMDHSCYVLHGSFIASIQYSEYTVHPIMNLQLVHVCISSTYIRSIETIDSVQYLT